MSSNSARTAGRSSRTAGWMRRPSTATMRRSGRCWRSSSPANPATCWRSAAAPASTSSHFARHTPGITWWPSDLNEAHLKSIEAWRAHAGLPNIRPPLRIDLTDPAWCRQMHATAAARRRLTAVFCANVIHIAPWRVAEGLFAGAGRYLRADGRLLPLRPVQARRQAHRGQQRRVRHQPARRAIPNGACATSPTSSSSLRNAASRCRKPSRCPPTT